jgi:hypothetical protein
MLFLYCVTKVATSKMQRNAENWPKVLFATHQPNNLQSERIFIYRTVEVKLDMVFHHHGSQNQCSHENGRTSVAPS